MIDFRKAPEFFNPSLVLPVTDAETNEVVQLNFLHTNKALNIFRAYNNKVRQQLLSFLNEQKRVPVTEIYRTLKIEQSVASQPLNTLRRAGLITATREGKWIYYSINYKRLKEVSKIVDQFLG
ncbi:hypothetical protein BH11BAC6_BH11BAC6_07260 [soil metagenome]